MHQWLGLMIYVHKAKFDAVAKAYLNKKGLTMAEWLKGVKKELELILWCYMCYVPYQTLIQ